MLPYLVASGLFLHVFLWGAGLAMLAMPAPWRRYWPVIAPACGAALQSLAVWAGAYADLRGTDSYAGPAELVAVGLLILGLRARGLRDAGRDLARLWAVWAVTAACLAFLIWPLAHAASGLTTASVGSCDAADYAAGARVLKEFARSFRGGFMGLTEVVRVLSADNFFDFWLRLNHFSPSAMIALNGTILNCAPHEITGILGMALLASAVPVVFWTARSLLGHRPAFSVAIAALFALSPVPGYAVSHVALGQLLAAPAVALLTWASVCLWRTGHGLRFVPLLAVVYGLLLGCYNFFIIVCFVPAGAYAALEAARLRDGRRFLHWARWMIVPFVVAVAVFWGRLASLPERIRLFQTYDFGWAVPGLSPEGWLGAVARPDLSPFPLPWRGGLGLLVGVAMVAGLLARVTGRRRVRVAVSFAAPVLVGYGYLLARGALLHTNASYDAYKLLAVFFPLLLPAFWLWAGLLRRGPRWIRPAAAALAVAVVGLNLAEAARFSAALGSPPLVVDRQLLGLRRVEGMKDVKSVNMLIPDMWSRLWANAFLLKKPQYFATHTYEGRLNTPLRGEWDLCGGILAVSLPGGDSMRINSHYSLARTASPCFLRGSLGDGWYDLESLPRSDLRWRWTSGDASILVENPHATPLTVVVRLDAASLADREIELSAGGARVGVERVGLRRRTVRYPGAVIPPGSTRLDLRSALPPSPAPAGDTRLLGFAAYEIVLEVSAVAPEVRP